MVFIEIYQGMEEEVKSGLEIRLTTCEDFDRLTYINRICFPEQLRWRLPKAHVRKWWNLLFNSEHCKLWTCSSFGKVVAYNALVLDRSWYEDVWERQHFSFFEMLYIFVTCPDIFVKKALTKIKQKRIKKSDTPVDKSGENQEISTYERIRKIIAENTPWCGPCGVLPTVRRQGVATKLIQICCQTALELGYREMNGCLKRKNIKSKGLMEGLGFTKIDEVDHLLFYRKKLE